MEETILGMRQMKEYARKYGGTQFQLLEIL